MKRLITISQEERNRISNLHESAIKKEILSEQPFMGDMEKWKNFPCVTNHKGAQRTKLPDGTFTFKIGGDYYYNNGRKQMSDGTRTNYSCDDEIFQSEKKSVSPSPSQEVPSKQPLSYYVREAQKLIGMPEEEQDGKFGPDTLKAMQSFIEKLKG